MSLLNLCIYAINYPLSTIQFILNLRLLTIQQMAQPTWKDYSVHGMLLGRQELSIFFQFIEVYRKRHHPTLSRFKFVKEVINRDRIRVGYRTYNLYLNNAHRPSDRMHLPNFFFVVNILEPLGLSLWDLYSTYHP